jgi:hypothetical protein
VITGEDESRGSTPFRVDEVEPLVSSFITLWPIWGWDDTPTMPISSAGDYTPVSIIPPVDGARVVITEFPADRGEAPPFVEPTDVDRRMIELADAGGRVRGRDPETGLHSTDSIDIGFVLSGEIVLVQEGDSEVTLGPGDCLVLNASRHTWRNRSGAPCRMGFVSLGTSARE